MDVKQFIHFKPTVIQQLITDMYEALQKDVAHLGYGTPEDINVKLSYMYRIGCLMWKVRLDLSEYDNDVIIGSLDFFEKSFMQLLDMCQAIVSAKEIETEIKTIANYDSVSDMLSAILDMSNRIIKCKKPTDNEYYIIVDHTNDHKPVYGVPTKEFVDNGITLICSIIEHGLHPADGSEECEV